MRDRICLDGTWDFCVDKDRSFSSADVAFEDTIDVPSAWQAAKPELRRYTGRAWYRKTIDYPDLPNDRVFRLCFGAVDHECTVWVNGIEVGRHSGGYTPFRLDVTHALRSGRNEILVMVDDWGYRYQWAPRWLDQEVDPEFEKAASILHGKQTWYADVSGIWQSVWLESLPVAHINGVRIYTDPQSGSVTFRVATSESANGKELRVEVLDQGQVCAAASGLVAESTCELTLQLTNPKLWSLDSPNLYEACVRCGEDTVTERFGVRSFDARDGKFFLNGSPLYMRGALDQDFYPGTIYAPPSKEYVYEQFRLAKELGLNTMRCHIKVPHPWYLEVADELGILIWEEIPSWGTVGREPNSYNVKPVPESTRREVLQTLEEMVDRDFNHPSLVIRTIVNEDWGTHLVMSQEDRSWLKQMYHKAKELDPTRLVVDNSACYGSRGPNLHVKSDINDFHVYALMPDEYQFFASWVEHFAQAPLWTWSPYEDSEPRGDEPLVVSEFGNWGLPSLEPTKEDAEQEGEPWWFMTGGWGGGIASEATHPTGVARRFHALGLDRVWDSYEDLARGTQRHQYEALRAEIEVMRLYPSIVGYVITEFTDAYWEANGLLDFYRNPKYLHEKFSLINTDDVLIPDRRRGSYWAGEELKVPIRYSKWSEGSISGAGVYYASKQLGGGRQQLSADITAQQGQVVNAGEIKLRLPDVDSPTLIEIEVWLEHGGRKLAANTLELMCLPAISRRTSADVPLAVVAPESNLSTRLRSMGCDLVSDLKDAEIAVATRVTPELDRWVKGGGKLLLVADETCPYLFTRPRAGSPWQGNWCQSWTWILPGSFSRVYVQNPLGFLFREVMPRHVIMGYMPEHNADVLAGMFVGWLALPAAVTTKYRVGKGMVLHTTFDLARSEAPVSDAMLADLVDHIASPEFYPERRLV